MDQTRFDALAKRLATEGISRRGFVRALGGSLAGLAGLASGPAGAAKGGSNSACAHFCAQVFGADTPAAGQCTSQAAHGTGPCYHCGPGGGTQKLCGTACIAQSQCCTNADCPGGTCQSGTCVANNPCATVTCAECTACSGGSCVATNEGGSCSNGGTCHSGSCVPPNPCAGVTCGECTTCSNGSCVAVSDGTTCSTGTCQGGTCVAPNPCAGVTCAECKTCSGGSCVAVADGTSCSTGTCSNGSCVASNPCAGASDGTACPGGTCSFGTCQCVGNPACGTCQACLPSAGCVNVCTNGCTCPGVTICNSQSGFCENPGGGNCFVAGTRVALADGTSKPIELVAIGDSVVGRTGVNRVVTVLHPTLGDRPLYALNDGAPFVTASHPFLTEQGWKAVDPAAAQATVPGLAVGRLAVGDRLQALVGLAVPALVGGDAAGADVVPQFAARPLARLEGHPADPATPLYHLQVDGDHTYLANDLVVHNKIVDSTATTQLD